MTKNFEISSFSRSGHEEVFLTAATASSTAADDVFAELADELAARGAVPFREKVYGTLAAKAPLLAARARHYDRRGLDASAPVGFIDGSPVGEGDFSGVQVHAICPGQGHSVAPVEGGTLWRGPDFRMLHLVGIGGIAGECISEQAANMFAAADDAASVHDFSFGRTARTWIYLARLLDWYGEFNRVRSDAYRHYEFAAPPSSTGIQGRGGDEECLMDALLVDGLEFRQIDGTRRQGSACSYGSRFSRGVTLEHDGGCVTYVSGTASIDGEGRSLHLDDPIAQCTEMLLCVAAVLAESDMTLADICESTLFCRDEQAHAACREVRELLGVAAFPTIEVRADVCRPELLVELEAVACR